MFDSNVNYWCEIENKANKIYLYFAIMLSNKKDCYTKGASPENIF